MAITERQVFLVQQSFEKVVPLADAVADIFYKKLFEIDPGLKTLFTHDMAEQKKKLMQSLVMVIRGLKDLEKIVRAVQALGKRHVDYGVKAEDYTKVGNALLRTLAEGLGKEFNDELREAWIAAYKLLADTMKKAAYP